MVMMLVVRSERGFIFSTMLTLTAYIRLHLPQTRGLNDKQGVRTNKGLGQTRGYDKQGVMTSFLKPY